MVWNILQGTSPGWRAWNQVAYDRRPLIAGGGFNSGYRNDFWAFENGWAEKIQNNVSGMPCPREHQAFVHCPKDGKTYFWNGHTETLVHSWPQRKAIYRIANDSWEDTGAFTYDPALGPDSVSSNVPMRMSAGNVWCPPLDGFLIVGGGNWDWGSTYLLRHSDLATVKLDAGDFVLPAQIRFNVNNQVVWADEINSAVLFGGDASTVLDKPPLNDLKVFDTLGWRNQPTQNPPPPRGSAALVYRPGKIGLFGGRNQNTKLKDAWELDLQTWAWERLPDMPHTMYFHGGWWHQGKYMIGAGLSDDGGSGLTLTFTPETKMKAIRATLSVTGQTFPAGTTPASYRFEISGPESRFADVAYGADPISAQFDDPVPGTYTVTAELLSSTGARLGNLLSQQVIVAEADIILQVPAGLTVQVITI